MSGRVNTVCTVVLLAAALTACGSNQVGTAANKAAAVEDHVHAAVPGPGGHSLLLATHYGLEDSTDGGRTWHSSGGLGDEMIAGLVRSGPGYVAALQMMPGMSMPQMSGMSMSGAMPDIAFSRNGKSWDSPQGIPANAQVASISTGADSATVWAALLGKGVYRSTDAGHSWHEVIPAAVPISVIKAVGQNLLMATPSGVFVTSVAGPSMPALAQLDAPVNDLTTVPGQAHTVVAALGAGGLAVSDDAGVTWKTHRTPAVFDELFATKSALFGMVPSTTGGHQGVWRSTDDGKTWQRTLDAPLVDHMYGTGRTLLAFEWGIKVFRSLDGGRSWSMLSRIAATS